MPVVTVDLIAGYDSETKTRLAHGLTDAVLGVVAAPPEAVTVMLNEHAADAYMRGGTARQPGSPRPVAEEIVREFLAALEVRALDKAQAMLGEGFAMTFPGGARMTLLSELMTWSAPRYARITKSFDRVEGLQRGETSIVYCTGTLAGEWLDGTPFDGIRFVDRFEVEKGLITRQEVWNDMAEARAGGEPKAEA